MRGRRRKNVSLFAGERASKENSKVRERGEKEEVRKEWWNEVGMRTLIEKRVFERGAGHRGRS